jgi:hypothetical protein
MCSNDAVPAAVSAAMGWSRKPPVDVSTTQHAARAAHDCEISVTLTVRCEESDHTPQRG